ncbi:hypothetical protein EG68_02834 [Paragonimus skrjabini miyazakii]|uniref:CRAL-TRIO domain-containing protein n=1 Tax=Paragonimus skrjabini miyazakii TaxID=59628 RepID=A0A8S9Z830_9TREM|nr:hypothetical protein EG68_02834 [Paragonimus skrjabini miyazakii]
MAVQNYKYSLSPDAELSEYFLYKAQKELHEKPSHVQAHITSLRRWVASMPHLKCPDDDRVYKAFLRHSKYEHSRAQAKMDNFATLRTSELAPSSIWFKRPRKTDPSLQTYLRMGIHCPAGFLEDGTFLLIVRMGKWDAEMLSKDDLFRFATLQIDRLIQDPRIQICGLHLLFDLSGVGSTHITKMNPKKTGKEILKLLQEGYPIRIKSFIYYNEPALMDFLLKIMTHWLKPKLKDRIIRVKDDIGKAQGKIPGLKAVLPREYDGDNRSIEEIIDDMNTVFFNEYDHPRIWDRMCVNESKRPDAAKHFMAEYKDYSERSMGIPGTYVKLPEQD